MDLHGQSFIGDRLSGGNGDTFRAVSPLDSSTLEPAFHAATEQRRGYARCGWPTTAFATFRESTGAERAGFLERIADEIIALGDDSHRAGAQGDRPARSAPGR